MARFSQDTKTFPLSVWKVREQHLTTVPKVLRDAVMRGDEVKGTYELVLEDGRFKLVLNR